MALELKIPITADANSAISGLNETADSASKLFKEFVKGEATLRQFETQLGEDLAVAASKAGYGLKGMQAQYKGLLNFMERARQKYGDESEIYKDLAASADYAKKQIDKLRASEEGLSEATNTYAASVNKTTPAVDKFAVATKELDQTSKSYLTRLVTLTKNILTFQLIMGPIRSAISGVKNTLKDSMKIAAEAEQVYSKLSTVFNGFEDSARRASIALASSLGVARSTSASALSTVGDLLQAQGMGTAESLATATGWVKQFQDIIAFKDINMSLEEFAQNFMSGAAGNLRNFRTFGSIVKESAVNARLAAQGLDKLTGSQLELAKMTTRAEMALEQQKNAMGATEREWDTMLSVNRRLSEAWKEYKENLGDTVNSVLKPMKRHFADMLTEINKVKRAAKELEGGALTSSVYNIRGNEKDYATFRKNVMEEFNAWEGDYTRYARGTIKADETIGFEAMDYILRMFNASVTDLSKILGDKLPHEAYELLHSMEAVRKEEQKRLSDIESRKSSISAASDSFSAFQEALLAITGVRFEATSVDNLVDKGKSSDVAMNNALGVLGNLTFQSIDKAIASLSTDDLAKTFGDVISGALDELDEAGLREIQVESFRKLYEAAWNQFAEGGYTEEEIGKLNEIKTAYKNASDALDEYNKKIQRQNALLAAYSTEASALSGYSRLKYESGLTGPESSKNLDMALTWDIPLQVEAFAKSLRDAGVELGEVVRRSEAYKAILEKEANLKYEIALKAERETARQKMAAFRADISPINYTGKYAEADSWKAGQFSGLKELANELLLLGAEAKKVAGYVNETTQEISKEYGVRKRAIDDQVYAEFMKNINPFASVADAYKQGKDALEGKKFSVFGEPYEFTGAGAGIIGILSQLLSQMEVFSELTNIVSDTIVPILDAVMKPLIPMINVVKTIFDLLPWEGIFDIFKIIASVVVAISFPIKIIAAVIKNIYTAVHNILQRILHPITGGDQRAYESLEAILDDTKEKLDEIAGLTFKIERNTEKDDLATLRELYRNKVISEQQFYTGARVLQKDIPFEALDSYRPSTTVKNEYNITINANDEAGMANVERMLEQNNIPVTHAWAGYSVSGVGRYKMAMGGR